jgi:hypothetical protein
MFASAGFELFHVAISVIGIVAGFTVLGGLFTSTRMPLATFIFLLMTLLTSLTGFLFPFNGITPAIAVGILSTLILIVAFYALYAQKLQGWWRPIYVLTAMAALYLNVFVLVVQTFVKFPVIHSLAPNGNEPPFAIVQGLVLLTFAWLTFRALKVYRPV